MRVKQVTWWSGDVTRSTGAVSVSVIYKKEARMKVKVALQGHKAAAVSRARGDKDEDSDVLFGVTRTDEIKAPESIRGTAHVCSTF